MIAIKAITALALLLGSPQAHPGVVGPGVERAVERHGAAFVQVAFAVQQPRTLAGLRSTVRSVRTRVLARAGGGFRPITHWNAVLGMAGWVTPFGLRRLAASPDVSRVYLDMAGHAEDLQADALVHADQARAAGYTGAGVTVGILDSGMQEDHPDLADSLVTEYCSTSGGNCPNGLNTQTGAGAARDDNGHGTNVAGIVTGNGTIAPVGIAPSTKVVAVRVLAANGSFGSTAQVITGLQFILDHPEYGVKVINMSLGTDALFPGTCDGVNPNFTSIVHSLRLQGVTLFASSGNQQATTEMALPACIKEVVAVGAVYDSNFGTSAVFCNSSTAADKVTCFSNSSSALDLLAPGAAYTSTGRGSGTSTYYGTSQASPTAAATAADLLQKNPALTPAQIESTLKATGKLVTDSRNGRVTPRVDVIAALDAPVDTMPPTVRPRATNVRRKAGAMLFFTLSDNSGGASVDGGVYRRGKELKHFGPKTFRNGRYRFTWRASGKIEHVRFCLSARDRAGNQSGRRCALVSVT